MTSFRTRTGCPTLLAAAGEPDVVKKVADGYKVGDKTFKQHLDGYNFMPFFQGKEQKSPRHEIFYFDQGGNLNAVRYDDWKVNFAITEGAINTAYRKTPAWPIIVNLRADPSNLLRTIRECMSVGMRICSGSLCQSKSKSRSSQPLSRSIHR